MGQLDLILWGNTKAAISTFARANPPANPLVSADGTVRPGVDYCWWAGEGKLMTAKPVYSGGTLVTPPTFLAGFVMILRLHTVMYDSDRLADTGEQWVKSRVAKYIKDNGVLGSVAGGAIPYYELSGVRIFRPADVTAWLAANNLPGHEWVGGNQY
jgi:hypothetical protein